MNQTDEQTNIEVPEPPAEDGSGRLRHYSAALLIQAIHGTINAIKLAGLSGLFDVEDGDLGMFLSHDIDRALREGERRHAIRMARRFADELRSLADSDALREYGLDEDSPGNPWAWFDTLANRIELEANKLEAVVESEERKAAIDAVREETVEIVKALRDIEGGRNEMVYSSLKGYANDLARDDRLHSYLVSLRQIDELVRERWVDEVPDEAAEHLERLDEIREELLAAGKEADNES